jgi:hypothetical protein
MGAVAVAVILRAEFLVIPVGDVEFIAERERTFHGVQRHGFDA